MFDSPEPSSPPSQFRLLLQRRFAPFYATQLAGAFNDSLFKQVLVLLVTFRAGEYSSLSAGVVANLAAGLFILPFVLFSAYAGQLADRYDKALVIRRVKLAEVLIMLVACIGFLLKSLPVLLACLFAMGAHSAFFGPVKYSLLPRVLEKDELTGGNGLLEMGTFLSILLGTLVGGLLVAATDDPLVLSSAMLGVAVLGLVTSLFVPATGEAAPDLQVKFSVVADTLDVLKMARREGEGVWNSLLAISWFWFLGAVVLSQIPAIGKDVLHGDPTVVTLLLAVFSVGIALGSLLCERLSEHQVEIGLVVIGSLGLSVFAAGFAWSAGDLSLASRLADGIVVGRDWKAFLLTPGSVSVLVNLALLGAFGGLFIVPLYAFVQLRTSSDRQSRIISANNVLNAVFMVVAAAVSAVLLALGASVTQLVLVAAVLNAAVAVYVYRTVPEFLWRFASWIFVHAVYRVTVKGREQVPAEGAAVLAPNHVSYVDALVLSAISPRPIRFVMDAAIFRTPVLSWLFRQVKAIPIASARKDPALLEQALKAVDEALANGELVCIFPEGRLTRDGQLGDFRPGLRMMLQARPVPVVPVGLQGLWGSRFSRDEGVRNWRRLASGVGRRLVVNVGPSQSPEISLKELKSLVQHLTTS